ncbi:MAG: double-strand break repair protein AddB [Rhodospirillaceae bacterium]|nr:double-strand break repair protein AddB [Rhodospirillaceae bacterium]MYI47662.1 double-strand break repair protein AddB [Rhodospirillaceae bacterium]
MTGTGKRAADGGPARSVYTIPPQRDFVTALARGLLDRFGSAPEGLAPVLVLLPTRRACRTLREAFLRLSGGAPLLLPRMRPIGDVDEDDLALSAGEDLPPEDGALFETPPAIPELKRLLLLARLILERERDASAEQAVLLAQALARLLDQAQTERLSFDRLAELAPEELSVHWQESLDFLKIVTEAWPAVLEDNAAMDPAARRNLLLERLERRWAEAAPDHPVIAAGSTGSIPATADLLARVAALPDGQVVLPGLDRHLDEESWAAVEADEGHPQFGLARLLQRLEIGREDVQDWPEPAAADSVRCEATPARVRLVAEALRPAGTTEAWARRPLDGDTLAAALGPDLGRVVCRDPGEEARVIALAFRRTLDTPGKTATLVTPDRDLGRRVAAEMQRWGVTVDDSAGVPLAATPPASFLLLLARAVEDGLAPTGLLALLKHPLCAAGQPLADTRRQARALERAALRGPRPEAGIAGLRRRLAAARDDRFGPGPAVCDVAAALVDRLDGLLAPLLAGEPPAMPDYLRALCSAAATLAATPDDPAGRRLWAGDAGEALAGFIDELADAGAVVAPDALHDRAALLATLMLGRVVRPRYGAHPRLAIQGPLEARLHHADLTILGGLNEGAWPPEAPVDPWMSRPMRQRFGLPSPERRTGLSAHDFAQAFCAPEVLVTRSEKVGGSPAVASRWLQRLDTVLEGALDARTLEGIRSRDGALVALARQLDRPARVESCARPQPRPPVADRPRKLSVTQIERWLRDPYTIYARHILRLKPLDDIDADPGALERGIILHDVFEAFVRDHPAGPLPPDALPKLLALGRARFIDLAHAPGVAALWWPRFERAAEAFVAREAVRRAAIRSSHVEVDGRIEIAAPGGPFTLTGKADRIDLKRDGGAEILDYKTGSLPKVRDVASGFNPQLALEGLMLRRGGFADLPAAADAADLTYWQVSGGRTPLDIRPAAGREVPAADLIDGAETGLARLVAAYDDPGRAYAARPASAYALAYNDYEHLARIREWALAEAAS